MVPLITRRGFFKLCDLRIGRILECQPHPESENLYISKIDIGFEHREILSGLQKFVPLDQMSGNVLVFANLKPRKLIGTPSFGMVLCAKLDD